MTGDVFVDTNILVYAHDRDAGEKHKKAREKIARLWQADRKPSISVQVLQEFFVTLVRKGVKLPEAREIVHDHLQWRVVENTSSLLVHAMTVMETFRLSFWDSLIIAAAKLSDAEVVWSEDLSDGQDYDGVRVVNPLK